MTRSSIQRLEAACQGFWRAAPTLSGHDMLRRGATGTLPGPSAVLESLRRRRCDPRSNRHRAQRALAGEIARHQREAYPGLAAVLGALLQHRRRPCATLGPEGAPAGK